ncbi:charged multivesicular body protein 3-like [Schistocerca gregaria]|uniref:charged multivesicular body protein 3-like n=1 Tax=Schistocerca gregaria TaxID=7010 RepID=UPI00211F33B4|nr:charged multivesicular body protein 3-like [Schistocerca gregaria]
MDSMQKFLFKPNDDEVRNRWRKELNLGMRQLDRSINNISKAEIQAKREIRTLAKKGRISNAKILAKEIVRNRKIKERLYISKAHLHSISMYLRRNQSISALVDRMKESTDIMVAINETIKIPQLHQIMIGIAKEMEKVGIIEDVIDDILDEEEGLEEDVEEGVDEILAEIAMSVGKELPAVSSKTSHEELKNVLDDKEEERGQIDI